MSLILFILLSLPRSETVVDRFDEIEVNSLWYYDSTNDIWRCAFTQLVFWDHGRKFKKCQGWKLMKPEMYPKRDFTQGDYVTRFWDGETLREVRAPILKVSEGDEDPELLNRKDFPMDQRRGLTRKGGWREPNEP